jgi:hypothetical protein
LTAVELERLVVAPPASFAQLPDSALKTGLMDVGNPASGQIGIGFASQQEIVGAGFQRGWEKAFRASDGAIVDINLVEFRSSSGPNVLVTTFESRAPKSYARLDIPRFTHASGFFGTSPEGRAAYGTVFADARFLVAVEVGGPPRARDYRGLIVTLTEAQFAQLKTIAR